MLDKPDQHFIKMALPFWDSLRENDKCSILEKTNIITYSRGQNIHSAGNDCSGTLIVKSGELRTYILSEDGREFTLYRLYPSDVCILSSSCFLKKITFDVHIDAEVGSEVFLINPSLFAQLQEQNVYVENFALKIVVDRFSYIMQTVEQVLFMKLDRRLASFLISESEKTGSDNIKLTHEQIAKYIGSAREVVSRMLKQFENEEAVTLYRGGVCIVDKECLRQKTQ